MGLIALALGAACLAALLAVGGLALADRRPPLRPEPAEGEGPGDGSADDGAAGSGEGRALTISGPGEADSTVLGPAGTVREPWADAVRRLGIEHAGAPDESLRAAVRYSLAVWNSLAGPDRAAPPPSQRLAVTLILADDALLARALAWDRGVWSSRTALKDASPERDDLYRRVAAALAR